MAGKPLEQTGALVEEEESYFVSMTDMMVGVIFIFIILLMVFALNFQRAAIQERVIEEELTQARQVRKDILESIEQSLREKGIRVDIDPNNGVLHLPEEILFPSGSATLTERGQQGLGFLAEALAVIIPCYANPELREASDCEGTREAFLEVVAIEGHTDERPVGAASAFQDNWELSVQRAINTYRQMLEMEPKLDTLTNPSNQKIFSVSGYGEFRPRAMLRDGLSEEAVWERNRRIDLRFVMREPELRSRQRAEASVVAGELGDRQSELADELRPDTNDDTTGN